MKLCFMDGQNCCIVGCKSYFHKINATTPISGFIKHKDCTDYCRELHDYAGKAYGIGSPLYRISSGKGSKADRAAVLQSLDIVAKTMHNDLVKAIKNKDYITDENAKRLRQAAKFLQKYFYDHKEITEEAFFKLKDFSNTKVAKVVRVGGKVLLVAGVALDLME